MGITGLLPFLNKSSKRANIKDYAGQTVAVDAYCWLHKGAFSCAQKLAMNEPTNLYVTYCMKFVNLLLSHNIKPILVFDGRYLPAKAHTEKKRRENRLINRRKAAAFFSAGNIKEGQNYLRRSVDVTHEMALNLIKECRQRNIDCIVAPYEADAQLAYLNIKNIAQLIITEDSDLLLFGCIKVLFKMDINGNGILIEKDRLYLSMGIRHDKFCFDKFRYMCILSGCDYLPSLPGIGLNKACKFINRTSEQNIYEALLKLPINLQMWTLDVTDSYRNSFLEADRTFKYQLVYDPGKRKQIPLNETDNENDFVGQMLDDYTAFQLAIGNLDPMTLKQMDDYDVDNPKIKMNNVSKHLKASHASIWRSNFTISDSKERNTSSALHTSAKGICIAASVSLPIKRPCENDNNIDDKQKSKIFKDYLYNIYGKEKIHYHTRNEISEENNSQSSNSQSDQQKSPILFTKNSSLFLRSERCVSGKKKNPRDLTRFNLALETENLQKSRYFNPKIEADKVPSLLDAIEEEEKNMNSAITEKSFHNSIEVISNDSSNHYAASDMESNNTLDDRSLINEKKSQLPSIDQLTSRNYSALNYDNENRSSDVKCLKGIKNSFEEFGYFNEAEALSSTPNKRLCKKNFYTTDNSKKSNDLQISPYFQASKKKHNNSDDKNSISDLQTFISIRKGSSPLKLKKNTPIKRIDIAGSGKRQSLLTRFGFQPRPKIEIENTSLM